MSSKILKFSVVAATVAASFNASAALYNVYHYEPTVSDSETFGTAISPAALDAQSCFETACTDTEYKIAFEQKVNPEGFNYRDESPFLFEYGFEYLEDGRTGFENYCDRYLGYADQQCKNWASTQYSSGYAREGSVNNSLAFVEAASVQDSQDNVIINQIDENGAALGTYYKGSLKERTQAYVAAGDLSIGAGVQSKVFAKHNDLYVGSVSFTTSNSADFRSQAAVWDGVNAEPVLIASGGSVSRRSIPQGSARDITSVGLSTYAVGYNANSDEIPVAAVFNVTDLNSIQTKSVSAYSDDDKYLNSLLTSVNANGVAIGTVKYKQANDRAYSNSLFYVPDVTASSLASKSFSGDIFFKSANGSAGAINNNNVVVGQIDFEKHAESNGGKPRAKRAFVAPIEGSSDAPIFSNRAWYLDDLTYGVAANNQYRIIDAADINDAGVIAGTAYFCAGGFNSASIDASCSSEGGPSLVAVKLVPIADESQRSIQSRPREQVSIERQGAAFGLWALTLLGLIGFRRK